MTDRDDTDHEELGHAARLMALVRRVREEQFVSSARDVEEQLG